MNEEKVYSVSVTLPRWENFPRTIYKKGEAMILCQAYWFLIILSTLKRRAKYVLVEINLIEIFYDAHSLYH